VPTLKKAPCPSCRRERLLTRYGRCRVCGDELAPPQERNGLLLFLGWILREVGIPLAILALVVVGVRAGWRFGEGGGGNLGLVSLGAFGVMFLLAGMTERERGWRRTL
jgi:hypothetical protein